MMLIGGDICPDCTLVVVSVLPSDPFEILLVLVWHLICTSYHGRFCQCCALVIRTVIMIVHPFIPGLQMSGLGPFTTVVGLGP